MERTREVAQYWSWLPAFRAVAETEHLPTAARVLRISPSALSRTIKLLEGQLGQPLFDRAQGRLNLNPNGEVLLRCVRASMRLVHESTEVMRNRQVRGSVSIAAATGLGGVFILPVLPDLLSAYPELDVSIQASPGGDIHRALGGGTFDLALVENPSASEVVHSRPLGRLDYDVFVATEAGPVDLANFPFIAPHASAGPDGWPIARRRNIVLRVDSTNTAIEAARGGLGAVVLPVCVGEGSGLRRLHERGLRRTNLVLLSRSPLPGFETRADVVASFIQRYNRKRIRRLLGVSEVAWVESAPRLSFPN